MAGVEEKGNGEWLSKIAGKQSGHGLIETKYSSIKHLPMYVCMYVYIFQPLHTNKVRHKVNFLNGV